MPGSDFPIDVELVNEQVESPAFVYDEGAIMSDQHRWMLKAALDEPSRDRSLVDQARAG